MTRRSPSPAPRGLSLLAGLVLLAACAPSLDWREVRLEEADLQLMFPCKPDQGLRPAAASSASAGAGRMGLASCETAGLRFALSWAEMEDPTQITAALLQMPEALAAKLQATVPQGQSLALTGATANAESRQMRLSGRQADGRTVDVPVAVFTRGRTVYQLMVLGPEVPQAAWDTFLGSIRLGS